MPEKKTLERAAKDKREGKAPSTQAGEFIREEMDHVREGKHGARSAKQAIAIGLSKARRAGVKLPLPTEGTASTRTQKQAARDTAKGSSSTKQPPSRKRSRAVSAALKRGALKREGQSAASHTALSRQAHKSAKSRGAASISLAAKKAARPRARRSR